MKINKPIAGTVIRNTELHPTMTSIVIVADADSASLMNWAGKLDRKTWAEALDCSPDWEIFKNNEWHFMFPQLLRKSWNDNWYVPDCHAQPEGTTAEWLAIIEAIDNKQPLGSFRRLGGCITAKGHIELYSPRNQEDTSDHVLILAEDYPEWRRRALAVLTGTPLAYQISPSPIDKWIQLSQE